MVDIRTSCFAARLAAFLCPQKHWKGLIFRGALKKVSEDKELQEKLRPITTAEGIVAVAYQLGFHFSAPELIRHFAETLLHADDAQAVILFDALGWHFGSLLWALKITA